MEASGFQDALPRFEGIRATVVGVSPDPAKKHAKFKSKHGLTYTLVADTDHAVSERYGVWGEKRFMGRTYMGVNRSTYIIGPDGRIASVFEKVTPLGHAKQVAEVLERLG